MCPFTVVGPGATQRKARRRLCRDLARGARGPGPPSRDLTRDTLPHSRLSLNPCPTLPAAPQLEQGAAEIFGSELSLGQRVNLNGQAVAVFTWEGCTLTVDGEPDVA